MRIISKFHDYYDGVAKMGGYDPTIIYDRKTEVVYDPDGVPNLPTEFHDYRNYIEYLIFCGKLYFLIYLDYGKQGCIINDLDKVSEHTTYLEKQIHKCFGKPHLHQQLKELSQKDLSDVNRKLGSPIVLIEKSKYTGHSLGVTLNANISETRFVSLIDAYTAYQTLEQWVDTHVSNRKEVGDVDPVYRFEEKGFDNRTSFRSGKSKKKHYGLR